MTEKVEVIAELKDLISGKFKEINDQVNKLEGNLARAGKSAGGKDGFMNMDIGLMRGVTAGNLLANAITSTAGAVVDFGKDSVRAFGQFEQFQTSLTTMFQGNKQKAEILSGQLQNFAKTTPFELTEIQEATKMMLAYGSTAGGVVGEMRMLGDISSGVGAPLKDIAYLYGTLRTQGKAYAMDIRQFAGRGIPIIEALAKHFGVTKDKVMDLVSKGKVGFPEVQKALESLTKEGGQFAGMMDKQSQTLNGQLSNLADGWEQLKVKLGESSSGMIKTVTGWATSLVSDINTVVDATNRLDKSLTKGNAKGFSWWEKNGMNTDEYDKYLGLSSGIKSMYVDKAGNSELDALKSLSAISNLKKSTLGAYESGKMSPTDFNRQMALLNSSREEIKTILENFKEGKKADGTAEGKAKEPSALDKVAAANRPTQVNINIENLVREMQLATGQSINLTLDKAAEIVSKALMGAVNDVSVLAYKV